MKKMLLSLLLIFVQIFMYAQNKSDSLLLRPLNNINVNIFGDASFMSINYERILLINSNFVLVNKLGLGFNKEFHLCFNEPCHFMPKKYLTIPLHVTGNFGTKKHFFEIGIGGAVIIGNTEQNYLIYPIIGYRLSPLNKEKVIFRVFVEIPFSGLETDDFLFIPLGFSFGKSF